MKLLAPTLFVVLTQALSALSCDCLTEGPFLLRGVQADAIVRGFVTQHSELSDRGIYCAMKVKVLDVLRGDISDPEITVWGDNGAQCRPYVSTFPVNTEWIFAIYRQPEPSRGHNYIISICGAYWLRVESSNVVGRIHSEEETSLSLNQFIATLKSGAQPALSSGRGEAPRP